MTYIGDAGITAEDFIVRDELEAAAGFTQAEAQIFASTLAELLGTEPQNVDVFGVVNVAGACARSVLSECIFVLDYSILSHICAVITSKSMKYKGCDNLFRISRVEYGIHE